MQITFGSDFTEQLQELEQRYNVAKEDLVCVTFKGLSLSVQYPGYQVSKLNFLITTFSLSPCNDY